MDPFDWSRIFRSITAVGIGMQMGDETSVGKPRAYINREEKIRIRRARFPVVEERTVSVGGFLPTNSSTSPLDKGVSRSSRFEKVAVEYAARNRIILHTVDRRGSFHIDECCATTRLLESIRRRRSGSANGNNSARSHYDP